MIEVACHCGDVTLALPRPPDELLECNCSICRKSGFRGVYYREGEVAVSGALELCPQRHGGSVHHDVALPSLRDPDPLDLARCLPHNDLARPDRMG